MAGAAPWWLEEDATCALCLEGHALTLEVRCTGCDASGCECCVVTVSERPGLLCIVCRDEEAEP